MLRIHSVFTITIVLVNIGVTIWLMLSYPADSQGVGTLTFGDCSYITNVNTAAHLALNVTSSLFLGAGNYCMQILVSPSREEIDLAHSKGISLVIGIPNIKNLWHIEWRRVAVWTTIAIFATVLHTLLVCLFSYSFLAHTLCAHTFFHLPCLRLCIALTYLVGTQRSSHQLLWYPTRVR